VSSTLTVEGVMVASYICPAIGFHRCLHIVTTVNITTALNFFTVQIRICNLLLLATSLS
jgi:hypothetical protein